MSSFPPANFSTEVAFCSPEGKFLGVAHTWCSCEVIASSLRRNENVFKMSRWSSPSNPAGNETEVRCGDVRAAAGASDSSSRSFVCSLKACNGTYLCAGSQQLEHEREVGTSAQPFPWRMLFLRSGCVALFCEERRVLRNDLSMYQVPEVAGAQTGDAVNEHDLAETAPSCQWLLVPVPLKSEEGHADGYYSVTSLLYWGHDSAVLLTEHSSTREPSVVKSIPCSRASAIRRIDALLYRSNMPGADSGDLICPLLSTMTSLHPSLFYVQKRCFRNLEDIFADASVDGEGTKRLPMPLALEITRRVLGVIAAVHALEHVLLDATPRSFCESQSGQVASLQLVDMKNVMKLEPKTYSTPASFVTKSGGRFGVPTGLFVMVPQKSLFLSHLHPNCLFAAPEVLQTPGSVGTAADVFSVACILVWCLTGCAPAALASPDILHLDACVPRLHFPFFI